MILGLIRNTTFSFSTLEFIYFIFLKVLDLNYSTHLQDRGDRGSTVVKVLCYISEGRWFDPT